MLKFNPLLKYKLDRSGAGAGAIGLFQGDWDASGGLLPTTRADLTPIVAGDSWMISVAGTITGLTPTADLTVGDSLISKVDAPATIADWFSLQGNNPAQGEVVNLNVSTKFEISSLIPNVNDRLRVKELDTVYYYEPNGANYTVDLVSILHTALGGDTRWISMDVPTRVTYVELETKLTNSILIPEKKYIITDFATKYLITNSNPGVIHTAPVEEIVVTAATRNSLYSTAFSPSNPDELLTYAFNRNAIGDSSQYIYAEWDTGVDQGSSFNFIITSSNTFTIDQQLVIDSNFDMYFEDTLNWSEFYAEDLGTRFTVEKIGASLREYTLDGTVDLQDPVYNYQWIGGSPVLELRTGWITRRINPEIKLDVAGDFRNLVTRLYKVNTASNVYGALTTYSKNDWVLYNNRLYISMEDNNQNNTPGTKQRRQFMENISTTYCIGINGFGNTLGGLIRLLPDTGDFYDVPMFFQRDSVNNVLGFSIGGVYNINIGVSTTYEYNSSVFGYQYNTYEGITFGSNCDNNVFYKESLGLTIGSYFNSNLVVGDIKNCVFRDYAKTTLFYGTNKDHDFKSYVNSTILGSNTNIAASGYINLSVIFNTQRNEYLSINNCNLYGMQDHKFLAYTYSTIINGPIMCRNTIGSMRNTTLDVSGVQIYDNVMGLYIEDLEINGSFQRNTLGDYFSFITTNDIFEDNNIGRYCVGQSTVDHIIFNGEAVRNKLGQYFMNNATRTLPIMRDNSFGNYCNDWNVTAYIQRNKFPQLTCSGLTSISVSDNGGIAPMSAMSATTRIDGNTFNVQIIGIGGGDVISKNVFNKQVSQVTMAAGSKMEFNIMSGYLNTVEFLGDFSYNEISTTAYGNLVTFPINCHNNTFRGLSSGHAGIYSDYISTHLTQDYNCDIYLRQDLEPRLAYLDNTDNMVIVDPRV